MMDSQNHSVAWASPPTSAPLPATPAPAPTIIVYPTVSPETVIIPIISSIVVFPAAAFTVICCLRYRAKRARRRAKQPSFQAVLGIDLDLDERSEWENEVMGYTSVRGMSSPTSSMGSLQRNGRPPGTLAELPRRASDGAEDFGRKWNGHGPPDLLQLRRLGGTQAAGSDRNGTVLGERATPVPPTPPQGEKKREDERENEGEKQENGSEERENQIEEQEDQSNEKDQSDELKDQSDELEDQSEREYESKERNDSNEVREEQSAKRDEENEEREDHGEERSEVEDSWRESLRFIDDSSEAS
ncbi:hypothetical protein FJT64_000311 [Amphibalanus amphitrite]|uniref:Uncharacterized protein n=1 Tax=Amphibalanus amphitrite TaxID=1232801 RepID=A0A6A4W9D5_AMPAM|nr:hypothetical protein FJT64_000311 [Amphibalanus amphitrite]